MQKVSKFNIIIEKSWKKISDNYGNVRIDV